MHPRSDFEPRRETSWEPVDEAPPASEYAWDQLRWPLFLFIATCISTLYIGGPVYSLGIMTILTAHELGHYLQVRRFGIPASLPYFIPMPIAIFGTLGAVIAMRPRDATKRELFDVAISGPLAGLIPAIGASIIGLKMSSYGPRPVPQDISIPEPESWFEALIQFLFPPMTEPPLFGTPLILQWLTQWIVGPAPSIDHVLNIHPLAFAGWVGIFITALNLFPVGQLDGGHLIYALLPRRAYDVSVALIACAVAAIIIWQLWHWSLMIAILLVLGVRHPPTAKPNEPPLDIGRQIIGWLTLLFVFIGFTPRPIIF